MDIFEVAMDLAPPLPIDDDDGLRGIPIDDFDVFGLDPFFLKMAKDDFPVQVIAKEGKKADIIAKDA